MVVCSTKTNTTGPIPSFECIVHGAEQRFSISDCLCVHPRRKGEPGLLSFHFSQSSNIWRAEQFVGRSSPEEFGHGSDWLLSVGVTKDSFRGRKIREPIKRCQEQTFYRHFCSFDCYSGGRRFKILIIPWFPTTTTLPAATDEHFSIFQVSFLE